MLFFSREIAAKAIPIYFIINWIEEKDCLPCDRQVLTSECNARLVPKPHTKLPLNMWPVTIKALSSPRSIPLGQASSAFI